MATNEVERGTNRSKVRREMDHLADELATMRDQLRLELHLAGMEAKERLSKLDEELFELQQRAKRATEDAAHEIKDKLGELRKRLEHLRERGSAI